MQWEPEDDLGLYQPLSDRRYGRARHPAGTYFHESINLCFARLIEQDPGMLCYGSHRLL